MNEAKRHAIAAGHVFDGWTRHKDAAVVVEGSLIVGVVPQSELPLGIEVRKLPSEIWLAPGFIDLQVNGGGDVLFNNSPTPEAILAIAAAHRKFGTTALLPTFITDTSEKMTVAFAAAESLDADVMDGGGSALGWSQTIRNLAHVLHSIVLEQCPDNDADPARAGD